MCSRLPFASLSLAAVLSLAAGANAGDTLYTVSSLDPALRAVDMTTFITLSSVNMTVPGNTVNWGNGLCVHPLTGELWVIVTTATSNSNRLLGKVSPTTGVITPAGFTGMQFAGIAFDLTGTLYGVTGDGAAIPETLFTINPLTGTPTQFLALGNGNDGETIGLNPLNNDLLHLSGLGSQVFESVNTASNTVTNIPRTGAATSEVLSITPLTGSNFLIADLNDDLFVITDGGLINQVGSLDHSSVKGMAILPTPTGAYFRLYGGGCPATGGIIPALVAEGVPAAGNPITLSIFNGPAAVPAILTLGTGNSVVPISPTCSLQNMPILTFALFPLVLGGVNPGEGTAQLPLTLPPGFGPVDLYFQAVIIELPSLALVVSNPLQMHVQ